MISDLDKKERLLLVKFICAFAWSDLAIQSQERQFIRRLVKRMHLSEEEAAEAEQWLDEPPSPEEVNPDSVPRQHRTLFLKYAKQLIETDGVVEENEAELYQLLEELLA